MNATSTVELLSRWCVPAVFLFATAPAQAGALEPVALRCEYRVNPLGIDEVQPRLTWRVESAERGQKQTAYQILVSDNADALKKSAGNLWDSGKVAGSETVNIEYGGKPLGSRQQCFWKVRVWDKDDHTRWSKPAS